MAFSPAIPPSVQNSLGSSIPLTKERYWLASGSRDKFISIFDSESNYDLVSVLDHHTATITSLKFNQVHKIIKNDLQQEVTLISSSADKSLAMHQVDVDCMAKTKNVAEMGESVDQREILKQNKIEMYKTKIFSMDVAEQAQYMVIGQSDSLSLVKLPKLEKIWEKKFGDE